MLFYKDHFKTIKIVQDFQNFSEALTYFIPGPW